MEVSEAEGEEGQPQQLADHGGREARYSDLVVIMIAEWVQL